MACVWRHFASPSPLSRAFAHKFYSPSSSHFLFPSPSSSFQVSWNSFSSKPFSPSSSAIPSVSSTPLITLSRRNIAHDFFWSKISPTPNETNTVPEKEKLEAEEHRKIFDYEPWYDPRRGFPIHRADVHDNTVSFATHSSTPFHISFSFCTPFFSCVILLFLSFLIGV